MQFISIDQRQWGHRTVNSQPAELIDRLAEEVRQGIEKFRILISHDPCNDAIGYNRVTVELGVSEELFDLFLNGNSGYRAQYAQGVQQGEAYNRAALDAITGILVQCSNLLPSDVDAELCCRSLEGPYSKFWFPKSLSDVSNEGTLAKFPEIITWRPWLDWWSNKLLPRKGLLAPMPEEEPAILLNGSFVRREDWKAYKQKSDRSEQLHQEGWV